MGANARAGLVVAGRGLILLLMLLLVLWGERVYTALAFGAPTLADRVLTLELQLQAIRSEHRWLMGLIAADFLSTVALLRAELLRISMRKATAS